METHLMNAAISLVDIEKELSRLSKEEVGKKKARASLFNLIVYIEKKEREKVFEKIINSVISKFPCRVFMIVADGSSSPLLKTSVSTHTLGEGIYCEIIEIEATTTLHDRIPSIILPHLLSDLPIYLLWTQDPSIQNNILAVLESHANRIIFDAESTQNIQKFSRALLSLNKLFHCEVGDLNWSGLSGWRKLLANTFEGEENQVKLETIEKMKVVYYKDSIFRASFLQAWFAAQLGWNFKAVKKEGSAVHITYQKGHAEIHVTLESQDNPLETYPLPKGAILYLEIDCSFEKGHFVFKRHPETRQVFAQYSNQNECYLPTYSVLSGVQEGQEIIEEIFYPHSGLHYAQMLKILAEIDLERD